MIQRRSPIVRSPLPRSTTPVKVKRTKPRRVDADRNPEYRRWLREECKCVVCVKLGLHAGELREWFYRITDPAHTENNGMRSKGPDSSCAPLCRRHHQLYDAGRQAFEVRYGVDMKAEARTFYAAFLKITQEAL